MAIQPALDAAAAALEPSEERRGRRLQSCDGSGCTDTYNFGSNFLRFGNYPCDPEGSYNSLGPYGNLQAPLYWKVGLQGDPLGDGASLGPCTWNTAHVGEWKRAGHNARRRNTVEFKTKKNLTLS